MAQYTYTFISRALSKTILGVLLVVLAPFDAYAGQKFVIDTDRPMSDFVVACQWHSNFLNLHGGKKLVKQKLYLVRSGVVFDCGRSLYGDVSVELMHPLYLSANACGYSSACESPYSALVDGVVHARPISIDRQLDMLIAEYRNNGYRRGDTRALAYFDMGLYFKYLHQLSDVDMDYYRETYSAAREALWRKVMSIEELGVARSEPKEAIEKMWRANEPKVGGRD